MRRQRWWIAVPAIVGCIIAAKAARSDEPAGDALEKNERCATRLSAALLGRGASAELLANPSPQSAVDTMLADPQFVERFARFLNASFNRAPGAKPAEDAPYYLGKYVLEKKLPYAKLFDGAFDVDVDAAAGGAVVVKESPDGLGYFRSKPWLVRYAGNEPTGLKISTAYRIMNNVVGLNLTATTNGPDVDVSSTGRSKPPCNGCHFQGWSALDSAAKVLTRRQGTGDMTTFVAPPPGDAPQRIADRAVTDDRSLVAALVDSEAFRFNACRLSFKYLYGRPESACEAPVFDACMDAFRASGMIQSAIAVVAKDASFCQ